jgi:uncharacterized lipoprotein YajG
MRKTILALLVILAVSTLVLTGCKSKKATTDVNDQKATQTLPAK